jgi:hypothetical protein
MWLTILSNLQKGMAETTKLLGEMCRDRMSAHSSARPDSHESVLTAPEGADTPAPEGAHTPASEEVVPSGSEEANNSRSADEPLQSQRDKDDDVLSPFADNDLDVDNDSLLESIDESLRPSDSN